MDVFEKEIMPHDGDDTGDCDSIYGKTFDGDLKKRKSFRWRG